MRCQERMEHVTCATFDPLILQYLIDLRAAFSLTFQLQSKLPFDLRK